MNIRIWVLVALLLVFDCVCFLSVPKDVRLAHTWALIPGGGIVLMIIQGEQK